jgi:hypothetical protein
MKWTPARSGGPPRHRPSRFLNCLLLKCGVIIRPANFSRVTLEIILRHFGAIADSRVPATIPSSIHERPSAVSPETLRAQPQHGPSAEGFFQRYGFQMEMTREKSPLLGNPPLFPPHSIAHLTLCKYFGLESNGRPILKAARKRIPSSFRACYNVCHAYRRASY